MHVEKRDGYRVIVGGPVPPQADAITLGKTILVRERAAQSQGLMAHELVHVRQFTDLGPLRFVAKYVGSYLRFRLNGFGHMAAYRRIPLEVEASWVSRLHPMSELEPNAKKLQDRLTPRPGIKTGRTPRPRWARSRAPRRDSDMVKAAMAARPASDPNES